MALDTIERSAPPIFRQGLSASSKMLLLGLLAVLLTGANQDGARGLAQVKHLGGTTVVQDPDEAQVSTMPDAALALHDPDHILPLHGIGRLLVELERTSC